MNDKTLHERLEEEAEFCRKLQLAVTEGELMYWDKRDNPLSWRSRSSGRLFLN